MASVSLMLSPVAVPTTTIDAELRFLLVSSGLPDELLHALIAEGLDTVESFAALESDEAEARKFFREELGLNPSVPGFRGFVAKLVTAWQAARTRVARKSAADAEAHVSGEARALSRGTKLEVRRAWERAFGRDLDDDTAPAGPYIDMKVSELEAGELKPEPLTAVAAVSNESDGGQGGILSVQGSSLRVSKTVTAQAPVPNDTEALRTRIDLMANGL